MKGIVQLTISLFFVVSCNERYEKVTKYYENGIVKEVYFVDKDSLKQGSKTVYFSNGRISIKTEYTNNRYEDTIYYYRDDVSNEIEIKKFFLDNRNIYYKDYFDNGLVSQEGILNREEQKIGLWKNYDEDGNLHFTKEYKIIDGKEYTNQMWVMLGTGDTLTEGVSIKKRFDKDRLSLSDSIHCFFQVEDSAFPVGEEEDIVVSVTIPKDYTKENFTPDFSNRPRWINDSTQPMGIDVLRIPSLADQLQPTPTIDHVDVHKNDYKNTVSFYWKPLRTGKDTIRGYLMEKVAFFDQNDPANNKENRVQTQYDKKIYFEHPIEVVE